MKKFDFGPAFRKLTKDENFSYQGACVLPFTLQPPVIHYVELENVHITIIVCGNQDFEFGTEYGECEEAFCVGVYLNTLKENYGGERVGNYNHTKSTVNYLVQAISQKDDINYISELCASMGINIEKY